MCTPDWSFHPHGDKRVYAIVASIDCFGEDEVSSGGMHLDNLNVCNVVTALAQALCV